MDQATSTSVAMGQEQKMSIREIALDLTVFTLSNVNDAISFKPQLCFEVPKQDYQMLKDNYISFTGTSIRKNRSRLFFLPTNVSDELQKLNPSIPEDAKRVPLDGRVYYKNRLITELDYENVKRVEIACAFIAYTALNSFAHFETELPHSRMRENGYSEADGDESDDEMSAGESVSRALKKGNILGFRELGHLVGITPWHFHRVFKVITGLTIREYGQLCVEFIKKNKEIVNTCRVKVEQLKEVQRFSCLDDPSFLQDGSLQYAATENVVLLHEYFIDPNKSKEFKTKKNGGGSGSKAAAQQHIAKKECTGHDEGATSPLTQRSEIRKRRSSVMYGRMQRASQSSITSNSSLYECLHTSPSHTSLRSPDYYLSNDEQHSDNDSDDSAGSVLDARSFNMFPPTTAKSVSPPGTSRKGSIISVGSAGGVSKKNKRKSITGANIDALQNTMLHRRNRSDICTINLNLEPLQPASLDARLSPPPTNLPIEFNSKVFDANGTTNETRVDFSIGPLDYNTINENLFETTNAKPNDTNSLLNVALLDNTDTTLNLPSTELPSMDDILDPATLLDTNPPGISNLTPVSEITAKIRDLDQDAFFSPFPAEEDLLFDSVLTDSAGGGVITSNSIPTTTVYASSKPTNIDAFNF
ncbi:hypothetical protein HG537_0D02070 [Torulaspora globosa]|uniref:Uncharacterized protein n=1 Tax=Torulaspora globosa TaxID=48254 RepID=A0A7H9HSX2_9SACH|nr:hypothetical protein HG537_0D02070 [Torulaspora sp. CBS 2947]